PPGVAARVVVAGREKDAAAAIQGVDELLDNPTTVDLLRASINDYAALRGETLIGGTRIDDVLHGLSPVFGAGTRFPGLGNAKMQRAASRRKRLDVVKRLGPRPLDKERPPPTANGASSERHRAGGGCHARARRQGTSRGKRQQQANANANKANKANEANEANEKRPN